jgi:hypothetical protein
MSDEILAGSYLAAASTSLGHIDCMMHVYAGLYFASCLGQPQTEVNAKDEAEHVHHQPQHALSNISPHCHKSAMARVLRIVYKLSLDIPYQDNRVASHLS